MILSKNLRFNEIFVFNNNVISSLWIISDLQVCDSDMDRYEFCLHGRHTERVLLNYSKFLSIFLIKVHSIWHNSMSAEITEFRNQCPEGYCFRVNKKLPTMTIFLPLQLFTSGCHSVMGLSITLTPIRDGNEWIGFLFSLVVLASFPYSSLRRMSVERRKTWATRLLSLRHNATPITATLQPGA